MHVSEWRKSISGTIVNTVSAATVVERGANKVLANDLLLTDVATIVSPRYTPLHPATPNHPMKITEETLWSFIDGDLPADEAAAVSVAIAEDEEISNTYLALLEQHDQFKSFFKKRQQEQGAQSFSTILGRFGSYVN